MSPPTSRPYQNYYGAQLLDASGNSVDPPLPDNPAWFSSLFQNNVTSMAQFNAMTTDNFTVLADPFRAIYLNRATTQVGLCTLKNSHLWTPISWMTYSTVTFWFPLRCLRDYCVQGIPLLIQYDEGRTLLQHYMDLLPMLTHTIV